MTSAGAVLAERAVRLAEAARPLEGMVELLGPLAACFAAVGLYGLQEVRDGQVRVDPRLEAGRPAVQPAREIATRHGLEVVPGKLVWELRPAVPSGKGDAVGKVAASSGARSVMVAGDDLGDLAAFAAATQLAVEGGDTLRVAVRSPEAPERLVADADLVVEGPPGLRDFLERLTARPGTS